MRVLFGILVFSILVFSDTINSIEIRVNENIITTYDIQNLMKQSGKNKKESTETLINEFIQKEALKLANVSAQKEEINNKIQQIASSAQISVAELKNRVLAQVSWSQYTKNIKQQIQQEKFEQKIVIQDIQSKDDNFFKSFFKKNKKYFKTYDSIEAIAYTSTNQVALLQVIKNPMLLTKEVTQKKEILQEGVNTNKNVYNFLSNMKLKTFSPIVNVGDKLVSYFVISKKGQKTSKYKESSFYVRNLYATQNKDAILKKHLQNIKANSKIIYVRKQ